MEVIIRKEIRKAIKRFFIALKSKLQDEAFNVESELDLLNKLRYKVVKEKKVKKSANKLPNKIVNFIENSRPVIVCKELEENLLLVESFIVDEKMCCAMYKIVDGVQLKLDKEDMERCIELNLDYKCEI